MWAACAELGSALLAAQAVAWQHGCRPGQQHAFQLGARQTSPLTLGVVLRIKPLPAALVVAQQRHSLGVLVAAFTLSTKISSI